VEVRQGTGKIKILDHLVTEDVGRKINPMIIEGPNGRRSGARTAGRCWKSSSTMKTGQPVDELHGLLCHAMEVPKAQLISTRFPSPHNPLA